MTAAAVASDLEQIVESSYSRMLAIGEPSAGVRQAPEKWSKKEILGHLIDSAANNHQRFVRLQHEDGLQLPGYGGDEWVRVQNYAGRCWEDLVELWLAYNRHLAHVIRHADAAASSHVWKSPNGDVSLEFLREDYVIHLRHHLEQILEPPARPVVGG